MAHKDTVKKLYDSFSTGDMDTMMSLMHDDAQVIINGMHRFSGTYDKSSLLGTLAQIPVMFDDFKVEVDEIIEEGDSAFAKVKGTAVGMSADFGHFYRFKDGKIIEQWIIDDSQKNGSCNASDVEKLQPYPLLKVRASNCCVKFTKGEPLNGRSVECE